jgi:hypothetical protein
MTAKMEMMNGNHKQPGSEVFSRRARRECRESPRNNFRIFPQPCVLSASARNFVIVNPPINLLPHACEPELCAKAPEKSGKNHLNSLNFACARLNSDFQEIGLTPKVRPKGNGSAGVPPNTFQTHLQ